MIDGNDIYTSRRVVGNRCAKTFSSSYVKYMKKMSSGLYSILKNRILKMYCRKCGKGNIWNAKKCSSRKCGHCTSLRPKKVSRISFGHRFNFGSTLPNGFQNYPRKKLYTHTRQ